MEKLTVKTSQRTEMLDVTHKVQKLVDNSQVKNGVCTVFVPHTTAAVTINENADPDVPKDILMGLGNLIPHNWNYRHMEGNSDAHIKASLVGASNTIIVENGKLMLGTWQSIFFCEFDGPRTRKLWVEIM